MNEHFADIFTKTACPSQDKLLAYVKGELGAEERHEVELHLQDCELCSEAVEGLKAIDRKDQIPLWLRQAKFNVLQKLRKKTRKRRKSESYIYIAIVTIVVIFLLLAFFWIFHFGSAR